jgi:hypothetical protein
MEYGLLVPNFVMAALADTFRPIRVGLGRRPDVSTNFAESSLGRNSRPLFRANGMARYRIFSTVSAVPLVADLCV